MKKQKRIVILPLLFLVTLFYFCSPGMIPKENSEANIIRIQKLEGISSASAIEIKDKSLYIAGDDSPWLFELDLSFNIKNKIQIVDTFTLEKGRIPKSSKADYEASTLFVWDDKEVLLLFGSGTASLRNTLTVIDINSKAKGVQHYSLNGFYEHIRSKANIKPEDFNIEGAAYWKGDLILLNRGTNALILVKQDEFEKYIRNEKEAPEVIFHSFTLPQLEAHTPRFSGACIIPDGNKLIFCATIEDTPNWISDGEVLGSYIGIIDLNQPENSNPICLRVMHNSTPFLGKIESVVCTGKKGNIISLIAVTDNDDGTSTLLEMEVK